MATWASYHSKQGFNIGNWTLYISFCQTALKLTTPIIIEIFSEFRLNPNMRRSQIAIMKLYTCMEFPRVRSIFTDAHSHRVTGLIVSVVGLLVPAFRRGFNSILPTRASLGSSLTPCTQEIRSVMNFVVSCF